MAKETAKVFRLEKKSLRRVLGSWDLFSVGYGDVGSSIYYAMGVTALYALGATHWQCLPQASFSSALL